MTYRRKRCRMIMMNELPWHIVLLTPTTVRGHVTVNRIEILNYGTLIVVNGLRDLWWDLEWSLKVILVGLTECLLSVSHISFYARQHRPSVCPSIRPSVRRVYHRTRSQAVARIADRTASQQTLVPNLRCTAHETPCSQLDKFQVTLSQHYSH